MDPTATDSMEVRKMTGETMGDITDDESTYLTPSCPRAGKQGVLTNYGVEN